MTEDIAENEISDYIFKKGNYNKNLPVALTLEHVSPVTRLLEKVHEMQKVQKSLDDQKEDYAKKEEMFKRREERLRKLNLQLQEGLFQFDVFLQETEKKRRQFESQYHQTQAEIKQKQDENRKEEEKQKALQEEVKKLEARKKALLPFEHYLVQVRDRHVYLGDEPINIHARFTQFKKKLIDIERENSDTNNKRGDQATSDRVVRQGYMGLRNTEQFKLQTIADIYKKRQDDSRKEHERLILLEDGLQTREKEMLNIKLAVDNLFKRLVKPEDVPYDLVRQNVLAEDSAHKGGAATGGGASTSGQASGAKDATSITSTSSGPQPRRRRALSPSREKDMPQNEDPTARDHTRLIVQLDSIKHYLSVLHSVLNRAKVKFDLKPRDPQPQQLPSQYAASGQVRSPSSSPRASTSTSFIFPTSSSSLTAPPGARISSLLASATPLSHSFATSHHSGTSGGSATGGSAVPSASVSSSLISSANSWSTHNLAKKR